MKPVLRRIVVVIYSLCLSMTMSELLVDDTGDLGRTILHVQHSLDNGLTFTPRGTLTLRPGSATMDSPFVPFGSALKDRLREMCDQDMVYLLELKNGDGNKFKTFAHSCNLVKSGLIDTFTIHLDWRHKIVAISYATSNHTSLEDGLEEAVTFKSKVLFQQMEPGPQPDTAAFVQRMEQDKLAKERGETKDNRSFFAKYWMYIIPVVLVLAMSSANPEAQNGR